MKSFTFFFIFFTAILQAQFYELQNKELAEYFEKIQLAEHALINNELPVAHKWYNKAFANKKQPFAKDLYNSMLIAVKLKKRKSAYKNYTILKCLQYPFSADFLQKNFPDKYNSIPTKCNIILDTVYKKKLDSLFQIDQHFRKLANGNLMNKKKEISESDSITSAGLLKLIEIKGFPSEYEIGLSSTNGSLMQNFYLIIWHQMAMNHVSTQKVNFSQKLIDALNNGKILPEHAAFLIDLNNGTSDFWLRHFTVFGFLTDNGTGESIREQIINESYKKDCCYIHSFYKSENIPADFQKKVDKVNENRKKIGIGTLKQAAESSIFSVNSPDYILPQKMVEFPFVFGEEQMKMQKAPLIKIQ